MNFDDVPQINPNEEEVMRNRERLFPLARNLCVAYVANQLGVSLATANKQVNQDVERLGTAWFVLADYATRLINWQSNQSMAAFVGGSPKRPN